MTVRGSQLNQVWTNLLDNAIDALGEDGTITITTLPRRQLHRGPHRRRRSGHPAGGPQPHLRRLRHHEGGRQGTGLGLATAHQIVVERHDGSLSVDSEPGRTQFRVRLPIKH